MAKLNCQNSLPRWNIHQQKNTKVDTFQISWDTEDHYADSVTYGKYLPKFVTNAQACICQFPTADKPLKYCENKIANWRASLENGATQEGRMQKNHASCPNSAYVRIDILFSLTFKFNCFQGGEK